MGAIETSDWEHWNDISSQISFPEGTQHGTVFKVSTKIISALKAQKK